MQHHQQRQEMKNDAYTFKFVSHPEKSIIDIQRGEKQEQFVLYISLEDKINHLIARYEGFEEEYSGPIELGFYTRDGKYNTANVALKFIYYDHQTHEDQIVQRYTSQPDDIDKKRYEFNIEMKFTFKHDNTLSDDDNKQWILSEKETDAFMDAIYKALWHLDAIKKERYRILSDFFFASHQK